jgi:hypothetical protein
MYATVYSDSERMEIVLFFLSLTWRDFIKNENEVNKKLAHL